MNKRTCQLLLAVLMCLFLQQSSFAQFIKVDTARKSQNVSHPIVAYFDNAIGQQSRLYNGIFHQGYLPAKEGSAYFDEVTSFKNGDVVYDGFRYDNVPLMYDLVKDELVSLFYDKFTMYGFIKEKVSAFYIDEHHFVFLDIPIEQERFPLRTGYFELIHNGQSKIYVKRYKILQEEVGSFEILRYFRSKQAFYVAKNDQYYPVASESAFLNLFKDKKSELKKYLKENKVRFKKNPEKAMVMMATYYESLSN